MIPLMLLDWAKRAVGWIVKNWQTVLVASAILAVAWLYTGWRHRGELLEAERAARAGAEATATQWKGIATEQAEGIKRLGEATVRYKAVVADLLKTAAAIRTEYVEVPVEITKIIREAPDCETAVVKAGAVLADMADDGGAP